jgi:hypothetical protein
MIKTNLITIIVFFLALLSCQKKEIDNPASGNFFSDLAKTSSGTADAEVFIYFAGFDGKTGNFMVNANLYDSTGAFVTKADLSVEGNTIDETNTEGNFFQLLYPDDSQISTYQSLMEDSITVTLDDYYDTSTDVEVYFPAQLEVDKLTDPFDLDRNQDLTITWEKDNNSGNNKIGILLIYLGLHSHQLDSTNSTSANYQILLQTDDDGSHTISSSDLLNEFPANSFVHMYVVRGTSKTISGTRTGSGTLKTEIVTLNTDGQSLIFTR